MSDDIAVVREAVAADHDRVRALQDELPEPSPALLDYALDGAGLVLVSGRVPGNPEGYLLAILGPDAYISELVVAPRHRRRGRATALLEAVCSRAADSGCGHVRLAVHPDNHAARRCYRRCGFTVERRLSDYYEDGSPAVLMSRRP